MFGQKRREPVLGVYDYREYFMTIAAIFLALALGILIGVSFGEDFLVSNQREIIELMEQELGRLKGVVVSQEMDLERWAKAEPLIWRGYSGALQGKKIAILARREEQVVAIRNLLQDAGAETGIIIFQCGTAEETPDLTDPAAEQVVSLLVEAAVFPSTELGRYGLLAYGNLPLPWPPDGFILLLERDHRGELFPQKLWQGLQSKGKRVIAAFPWDDLLPLVVPEQEAALNLVDNIDTFWGRLALLEMITFEINGCYGFGRERDGLIPFFRQ